ncbi:aldose epimerase family protein [Dyella subtropica]|uniref:aldose epimerase family protein n=1 Tax=Dyella subtropica TaxID=2992127 RepID=UPI00224DF04E|nr:aldose epimerase family protein [Dyella subtropica]
MRIIGNCEGRAVREIVLGKPGGLSATVITWGATLSRLSVPLQEGRRQDVILGCEDFDEYLAHGAHMGAIAGRVANRIGDGSFELDGKVYTLPRNDRGRCTLHGGGGGFGQRPWQLLEYDEHQVTLALVSPDGDLGFPGTVSVVCTYRLLPPSTLRIEIHAETDAPTPLNLATHSYFNLDGSPTIDQHLLAINAESYTPVDANCIPTGDIRSVDGTPYDFRSPRVVGAETFDINYVLDPQTRDRASLAHAASLMSSTNGLGLEIWTTEPALQFYDAQSLSTRRFKSRAGLCLEPQGFPNAPNQPNFPSVILRPGTPYRQVTEYRLSLG